MKKKNILLLLSAVSVLFTETAHLKAQSRRDKEQTYILENPYEVPRIVSPKGDKIKNVILMIGDGMSLMHVYSAWTANRGKLFLDNCPTTGLSKTYCADKLITDSGAGGTAIATGTKTNYHYVGVDPSGNPLETLIDVAAKQGKSTGIVVTCRLNDATPADFCCHNTDREASYDIISDYVGCGADFVFGGGSKYFENRPDGRDIFAELRAAGYATPRSWEDLAPLSEGKIFCVTDTTDTPVPAERGDLLARASMKAIDVLHRNDDGFFLMIEGSQLDDYGHFNDLDLLMQEVHDFDRTVGKVLEWAAMDGETLVVVTADHETGGLTLVGGDMDEGRIVGKFSTGGHSGVMVPVYAFGPGHEAFTGIFENTDIFHKIKKLSTRNPERDVTYIVGADLHFDPLPESDQYYHVKAINNLSGRFIYPAYAPHGIAGDTLRNLDGVILAGDIFNTPAPEVIALYKDRYEQGVGDKTIHYPVFPGYGNHDTDPFNEKGEAENLKGRLLSLQYMDSLLSAKLGKGEILNLHPSSRSYSWNTQDVHFVQAQRYSGDTGYCESNLEWLAEDLKKYASSGNPVVYIQHYGVDPWAINWWPQSARDSLFDILNQYNIAAFLVGHTHEPSVEYYRGYPIYQVNNAWPDKDGNGSFAILRLKGDDVSIGGCRWKDGEGNVEHASPAHNARLPFSPEGKILYNAFSHNDYWRSNPLHDALSYRYNCVEADLWPIEGKLYVAHDRPQPEESILFEELYLKPLADRVRNNRGKVYPASDRPFYLMLDFKAEGEESYALLNKLIEPYRDLFCSVDNGVYKEGAVLMFISGDRPQKSIRREKTRYAFLDGQIKDLDKDIPASLIPVVSDNYKNFLSWNGTGEIPADQLEKMREIIRRTHREGKLFRWWGAPDTQQFKRLFRQEGVDLIGADDLKQLYEMSLDR